MSAFLCVHTYIRLFIVIELHVSGCNGRNINLLPELILNSIEFLTLSFFCNHVIANIDYHDFFFHSYDGIEYKLLYKLLFSALAQICTDEK